MNPMALIDGSSAAVVFGGTLLATVLRSGIADTRITVQALSGLFHPKFRAEMARSELAAQVSQIRQDGVYRARPRHFGDSELDEATDALIATRSIAGLLERHEAHKGRRLAKSGRAVRALSQAAELAPVFGLAGTLISLSQLPADGVSRGAYSSVISMAVTTTLYGLLLANMVLAPLARMVERQAQDEESARQEVIDWLAWQVAPAIPETAHRPKAAPAHARQPVAAPVQATAPAESHRPISALDPVGEPDGDRPGFDLFGFPLVAGEPTYPDVPAEEAA
jgi:chemotaxis protein MotA